MRPNLLSKFGTIQTLSVIAAGIITLTIVTHYWKKKRRKGSPKASCFIKTIFCSPKTLNNSENGLLKMKKKIQIVSSNSDSEININCLTPSELSAEGFTTLMKTITIWEHALKAKSVDNQAFHNKIKQLLEHAYKLKCQYENLFMNNEYTQQPITHSTDDSFVSAEDEVADLEDFNDVSNKYDLLDFYRENQELLLEKGIPYRNLRTQFVQCSSDNEYLIKLHCIRLAFQHILKDVSKKIWIIETMQQILSKMLLYGGKDPKNFLVSYEDMVKFVSDVNNHKLIEEELTVRNVKMITFYDVALDYILLDAFEDLDNPPSSVISVAQNSWLSNGIKETALTTAVWSVIKAKRCMLKYSDGFRSRFYTLSEQIIPFMAWGFLGPDNNLKDMCYFFKSEMLTFFIEIYDFNKCRYTSLEDLSTDVFKTFQARANNVKEKLI